MTPRWLLAILALCVVFSSAACSDDSSSDDNGGSNNVTNNDNNNPPNNNPPVNNTNNPPVACTSAADCGTNEVCDAEAGVCRTSCSSDDECLVAQTCGADGFCVARGSCTEASECGGTDEVCNTCNAQCELSPAPGARACVTDQNCFEGEICDPCRAICRPFGGACDSCYEDVECGGADDVCLDFVSGGRFCALACDSNTDCPLGFSCDDVDGTNRCLPHSGNCANPAECEENSECPAGDICGPQLSCVPGCSDQSGCANGQICDVGECKPPCTSDDECPDGAECNAEGACRIPGGCLSSRDCLDPGTYCNLDTFMCEPGCEADNDCAGLLICQANQCVTKPCEGNFVCAFGQVCNKDNGQCEASPDAHCEPCDSSAENQCGGEPNRCLGFQDEDGNEDGDYCLLDCDPSDRDACPVGYGCQPVQDGDGNVLNHVCGRACNRDPV